MSGALKRRKRFSVSDQLTLILKKHGLQQRTTIGDGSCLFHALKMMLELGSDVQTIRRDVLTRLRELLEQDVTIVDTSSSTELIDVTEALVPLRDWIKGRYTNWDDYFRQMANYSTYADDPCLWAASSLYDVKITVYVSNDRGDERERIFSKNVWSGVEPNNEIVIGNYDQDHYVATAPLDRSGGSESSESSESSDSDDSDDSDVDLSFLLDGISDNMASLLRKGKKEKTEKVERGTCLLVDMYSEAFPTVDDVSEVEWDDFLRNFDTEDITSIFWEFIKHCRDWIKKLKKNKKRMKKIFVPYLTRLRLILRDNLEIEQNKEFLNLLKIDFSHSHLGWEDYKTGFKISYKRFRIAYKKGLKEKSVVDVVKQNRLVKCISTAIKIGLNYQELEKFKVKHVPNGELMTVEDLKYLGVELNYLDPVEGELQLPEDGFIAPKDLKKLGLKEVMPFKDAKLKKVLLADLNNHPYWEGITVPNDMSDAISLWKLKNTSQYINPTKRETLNKIYKTFGSYDIDFDKATPDQLRSMCGLDTLKLAPVVHKRVCEYFETDKDGIEEAFRDWQASDRSYKTLEDDVRMEDKPFIAPPSIKVPQDFNSDVIKQILEGDFTNLARIIKLRNRDNHGRESKAEPLVLSDAPPDAAFARKLSDAFVKLGFLPEGYEQYCGVNVGEVRAKRSSDGAASPAKRPREKLFTAIEIH